MTRYGYEINPRPAHLGGGWRLRLLEDDVEVGGGVFPADPDHEPEAGVAWWNALTEAERGRWLAKAQSAKPVDAWAAYLADEAHEDALAQAEDWLATHSPAS